MKREGEVVKQHKMLVAGSDDCDLVSINTWFRYLLVACLSDPVVSIHSGLYFLIDDSFQLPRFNEAQLNRTERMWRQSDKDTTISNESSVINVVLMTVTTYAWLQLMMLTILNVVYDSCTWRIHFTSFCLLAILVHKKEERIGSHWMFLLCDLVSLLLLMMVVLVVSCFVSLSSLPFSGRWRKVGKVCWERYKWKEERNRWAMWWRATCTTTAADAFSAALCEWEKRRSWRWRERSRFLSLPLPPHSDSQPSIQLHHYPSFPILQKSGYTMVCLILGSFPEITFPSVETWNNWWCKEREKKWEIQTGRKMKNGDLFSSQLFDSPKMAGLCYFIHPPPILHIHNKLTALMRLLCNIMARRNGLDRFFNLKTSAGNDNSRKPLFPSQSCDWTLEK